MSGWISTVCPIWDSNGYEIMIQFIKELAENDGTISSTIMTHSLDKKLPTDKKYYDKTKYYHPEWFTDIEPRSVIEFFVRGYDNSIANKILRKALSLKPNKIKEGFGKMKLHIKENLNNKTYAEVQVGMQWIDDEFTKECTKINGNKCWIEETWISMDSDKEHHETSIWEITKGENCDILINPKYRNEWYGKIYVNSAINLDEFYPDYWNITLGRRTESMIKLVSESYGDLIKVGDVVRFIHAGGTLSPECGVVTDMDKNGFCTIKWEDGEISYEVADVSLVRDGDDANEYLDDIEYIDGDDYDEFGGYYESLTEDVDDIDKPSDCMVITVQSGLNTDGFDVDIFKNDKKVFHNDYRYGYNASYDPKYAKYAEDDYNNAKKYGWDSSYYTLKPYVTDIVKDLMQKYNLVLDDIVLIPGKNVFKGDYVNDKDVQRFNREYLSDI